MKSSIRRKLLTAFLTVVGASAVALTISVQRMLAYESQMAELVQESLPRNLLLAKISGAINGIILTERGLLIPEYSAELKQAQFKYSDLQQTIITEASGKYEKLTTSASEIATWKEISTKIEGFLANHKRFRDAAQTSVEGAARGPIVELQLQNRKTFLEMDKAIAAAQLDNEKHAQLEYEGIMSNAAFYRWLVTLLGMGLVSGGIFWAFVISGSLQRRIESVVELLRSLSLGDTSQRQVALDGDDEVRELAQSAQSLATRLREISSLLGEVGKGNLLSTISESGSRDEMARAMNETIVNLRSLLGRIQESSGRVSGSSREISSAAEVLSQGATTQASSLEEISSSVTELNAKTQESAQKALLAQTAAQEVRDATARGKEEVRAMQDAMQDISQASEKIAKIIKTIDEIAFQTNLLALNAAVEAARAGRHGKGFAVVADEVRSLAGRSAEAAKETSAIIELSLRKVENGVGLSAQTATAFDLIAEGIANINATIEEVSRASNEQARGFSQVVQGLGQVERVTIQNTASAEETASASQELADQSTQLSSMAAMFRLPTGASPRSETASREPAAKPRPTTALPAKAPAPKPKVVTLEPKPQKRSVAPVAASPSSAPAPAHSSPAAASNWGHAPGTAPSQPAVASEEPASVIALDDDEFGRYGGRAK